LTHPLDGVYERLNRADHHIRDLKQTLAGLDPHKFLTKLDPHTGDFSFDAVGITNPGLWLSVRAGEIVFLLRSSLDHLIAQWLIPRTPAHEQDAVLEKCGFPIYIDGDWKSFDWTKIPRATPELKAALATCQPCNRTDGLSPHDHPLAVIATMNNTDKHRHLVVTVVSASALASIGNNFSGTIEHLPQTDYIPGSSNVTPPVEAPLIVGNVGGGEMDVEFQGSTEIAFKQLGTHKGEPVVPSLEYLAYSVREIVNLFRSKFF